MKKLWHNWGDESIYGKILKCSQSCGADGILSFRGREENELFLCAAAPYHGATEEFI